MYKKIFVPVDNSEHSITSIDIAVEFAKKFGGSLVGSHAYAARMHDYRFKQMEFTLPEEYLVEHEMEKQRKIHDSLITMGLELISDSYMVVMDARAKEAGLPFEPKMYDGKNYKVIAEDINNSDYDLVVMGALGLGAVKNSLIGSVCERVVRRVKTDTLVVKNVSDIQQQMLPAMLNPANQGDGAPTGELSHENGGHIVVGIDGSPESYAGLRTALEIGKAFNKEVEAVSVYDPYLHYAMFNSIVNVLTEKASKVFKFEEQEKLHEDVIDTGLAKIYQSHLEVARRIADEEDAELKITLLDGKAFEKILQYVRREKPWLLVLGRVGVHSEENMDIGSNTENLLRMVPCNVLLSSQRYVPPVDMQAEESMIWTEPATHLLHKAPDFAQGVAKTTVHRWALERGHSVITQKVVEQAMSTILPKTAMLSMGIIAETAAKEKIKEDIESVTYICSECGYAARDFEPAVCGVCGAPPEKFQKLDKDAIEIFVPLEGPVEEEETFDNVKLKWTAEARALLKEVPEGYQRRRAKAQIEKNARVKRIPTITKELVAIVVDDTREDTQHLQERGTLSQSATDAADNLPEQEVIRDGDYTWDANAVARLNKVPEGFMRNATKKRVLGVAKEKDIHHIDLELVEEGINIGLKQMEEMIESQKLKDGNQK